MSKHELRFSPNELVFRRLSAEDVSGSSVRSRSLRLQVSVAREWKDGRSKVFNGAPQRFNGYAQIAVEAARLGDIETVFTVIVDEPSATNDSHSLIALVSNLPRDEVDIQPIIENVKAKIAAAMTVVSAPKKV